MSNKRAILTVAVVLVVINLGLGIHWFLAARSESSVSNCINNLRQIDGAKQTWALDKNKAANDIPTWADLNSYLPQKPVCPQGGNYILHRLDEPPTCSVGGPNHTLPKNQE